MCWSQSTEASQNTVGKDSTSLSSVPMPSRAIALACVAGRAGLKETEPDLSTPKGIVQMTA